MNEVKITTLKPDEKLLINLPDFTTREIVNRVYEQLNEVMKHEKIIVVAGCEIFVIKPETKIAVDKSRFVEMLRKL